MLVINIDKSVNEATKDRLTSNRGQVASCRGPSPCGLAGYYGARPSFLPWPHLDTCEGPSRRSSRPSYQLDKAAACHIKKLDDF